MMRLDYYILDVFTDTRFGGNPLAVVLDADALDAARMQTIAREFNLSETVFVLKPQNRAHTARVRIFTPMAELPFAGHPTVGAAALLAELRTPAANDNGGQGDALIVLEETIGIVRVGVRLRPEAAAYAEFDAPKLPEESGSAPATELLAAALGLIPAEIGFENHRPTRYTAGNAFAFVPVASLAVMEKARVSSSHWEAVKQAGRLPVLPADGAYDVGLPCAHVRAPQWHPGGPGDGLGGGGVRRRRAPLRCAARRHAQAHRRARLRDGPAEPDLAVAGDRGRQARHGARRWSCRAGGRGQDRGVALSKRDNNIRYKISDIKQLDTLPRLPDFSARVLPHNFSGDCSAHCAVILSRHPAKSVH